MCKMQTDEPGSKQETRLRCASNASSSVNFFYFLEKLGFVVFLRGRRRDAITTAHPVGVTVDAALADDVRTIALPVVKLFILL
jgi:hypothetical protein